MTLLWLVILGAASIVLHDELGALTDLALRHPALVVGLTLGGLTLTWLGAWALIARCGRALDHRGSYRAILRAERIGAWARGIGACFFVGVVQGLGWPSAVRSLIGNPVLIDEALALLPLVALAAGVWHAIEPIEARTANASLVRRLDLGEPLYPHAGRWAFVWMEVRHGVLPSLVPVLLLLGLGEGLERAAAGGPQWLREVLGEPGAAGVIRFGGAAVILLFIPILQRYILPTTPAGPGPLRDMLEDLSQRHGVQVRRVFIWRTRGRLAGASVIGVLPRVRAIVLSDVLLEHLSERQVRAVTAHEYAHIRRQHIAWWCVALMAIVQWVRLAVQGAAGTFMGQAYDDIGVVAAAIGAMGLGLWLFGWISRRFEWQADAFAAQHLSGHATDPEALAPHVRTPRVVPEAAQAMAGALREVARLNGTPTTVFGWRHGSVERRANNLERLVGRAVDDLPIDRTVRRIKCVSAALLLLALVLRAL